MNLQTLLGVKGLSQSALKELSMLSCTDDSLVSIQQTNIKNQPMVY